MVLIAVDLQLSWGDLTKMPWDVVCMKLPSVTAYFDAFQFSGSPKRL